MLLLLAPSRPLVGFASPTGGAGGASYVVTNLNDSGAGSLRAALEATEPRTVTAAVTGWIDLLSDIAVTGNHLTVDIPTLGLRYAGIRSYATNAIYRNVRIRRGTNAISASDTGDCLFLNGGSNILVDHCSLSWSADECFSCYVPTVTIRYCIISEPLSHPFADQPLYEHSKAAFWLSQANNITFHHNLIAHSLDRDPYLKTGRSDVLNNVIYNGGLTIMQDATEGAVHSNLVGNTTVFGADTIPSSGEYIRLTHIGGQYENQAYCADNNTPVFPGETDYQVASPFSYSLAPVPRLTAYADVLANAGVQPRDVTDARIVADVQAGTGRVIDTPADVGGWPDL